MMNLSAHHLNMNITLATRCTRLTPGLLLLKQSHYLVVKRSFWKLNKQTLEAPPPPPTEEEQQLQPPQPQSIQTPSHNQTAHNQPSQTQPAQPAHTIPSETQPAQPQTTSKAKQSTSTNNKSTKYQAPPKPAPSSSSVALQIPQDGIVYTHEQKWFFRLFGVGVAAQFGAWVFFLDLVGHNPRLTYSLSFPVLGSLIGGIFGYFARELSTHNVRELKLFPGGRAFEIVTYTLFGFRRSEILAIDQIVKPKKAFTYTEWRATPFPLRFVVLGDKTQYFISFHGDFKDPRSLEYIVNGGDVRHLK